MASYLRDPPKFHEYKCQPPACNAQAGTAHRTKYWLQGGKMAKACPRRWDTPRPQPMPRIWQAEVGCWIQEWEHDHELQQQQ